jgi:hypothetical protein
MRADHRGGEAGIKEASNHMKFFGASIKMALAGTSIKEANDRMSKDYFGQNSAPNMLGFLKGNVGPSSKKLPQ